MRKSFDVVVIGAGAAGLTAAVGFRKTGKSVLLIEQADMGGECTNSGCIPSKALLHHAQHYHDAVKISGKTPETDVYRTNTLSYVQATIDEILQAETPEHFEKQGITVLKEQASFVDETHIQAGGTVYQFKKAVIATGTTPREIELPGADLKDIRTNQTIFQLEVLPERLLIIGGGPIGIELAQAFAQLGTKVTIAETSPQFAAREELEISELVRTHLIGLGVTILTSVKLSHVENRQALFIQREGGRPDTTKRVAYDKLLVAVGRTPHFPPGLSTAGIHTTSGGIIVDTAYRTTNPNVYAIGDVAHSAKFTHTADASARQVVTHATSWGLLGRRSNKAIPAVTYTTPEVANVGMTTMMAYEIFGEAHVHRIVVPMSAVDRALTDNADSGVAIVLVRRLTGRVLGAHLYGPRAGELIGYFTLAIDNRWTLWRLGRSIIAYPTYAMVIKKVLDNFLTQQLQTLRGDLWLRARSSAPYVIGVTLWIAIIITAWIFLGVRENDEATIIMQLLAFITASSWGAFLYIATYTFRPLIFFPATALTILSGMLFGFWLGLMYTIIGAVFSAVLAYGIGSALNRTPRRQKPADLSGWRALIETQPFESVLLMRLSFMPFDGVSYGAGLLKVKFIPFALATLIGIIPGTASFVSIGASLNLEQLMREGLTLNAINPVYLAIAAGIFVVATTIAKVVRRRKPTL